MEKFDRALKTLPVHMRIVLDLSQGKGELGPEQPPGCADLALGPRTASSLTGGPPSPRPPGTAAGGHCP